MKLKFWLILCCSVVMAMGVSGIAFAFHSGGVAECSGCHSMHTPKVGGSYLMVGTDQSSTCLSCHEKAGLAGPDGYHVSTPVADMGAGVAPKQRTPGGDFGWLKKDYTWTVRGTVNNEAGASHGHNIVAVDAGYAAVAGNAPGGTFPANKLFCNSCHDPHGKYRRLSDGTVATAGAPIIGSGSYHDSITPAAGQAVGAYRLLAGAAYAPVSQGAIAYPGVPVAVAPKTYNQTEATNQVRVAYGTNSTAGHTTWGLWCGTCHPGMHSTGNYVHPVDQALGDATALANYNAYVKSGDMSGAVASSFTSLVPFIENSGSSNANYTTLASHAKNDNSALGGPVSGDQVSCMSCHRAHASGFPEMLRWNNEGEFIVYNSQWPGTDTTPTALQFARGRLGVETQAAYYDRPVTQFASYQRGLCNKCHAKD